MAQLPKPARQGDFVPTIEVVSFRCKQRLQQCRRTRTLYRSLKKFVAMPEHSDAQLQQLIGEWNAVTEAPGYDGLPHRSG